MKKDTILGFIALVLLVFALRSIADDIDCVECCRQGGRFASSKCIDKCGGCAAYSDEAMAEAHDYPPNDDVFEDY